MSHPEKRRCGLVFKKKARLAITTAAAITVIGAIDG
jgi:hypothetical protein